MKRGLFIFLIVLLLLTAACVSDTVQSGGVVVRGEPSPTPSVDYAALAADEDLVLITPSGKKYHTADCSHLSTPPIGITKEQAIEGGYTPCSRCHPEK